MVSNIDEIDDEMRRDQASRWRRYLAAVAKKNPPLAPAVMRSALDPRRIRLRGDGTSALRSPIQLEVIDDANKSASFDEAQVAKYVS